MFFRWNATVVGRILRHEPQSFRLRPSMTRFAMIASADVNEKIEFSAAELAAAPALGLKRISGTAGEGELSGNTCGLAASMVMPCSPAIPRTVVSRCGP